MRKPTKTKTSSKSTPKTTATDTAAPESDLAGAVARVQGDESAGPMTNAERQRRWREKKRESAKPAEPVVIHVTEADVEVAAQLGRTVWDIAAPYVRMRALDDEQSKRLGRALAPLVQKYMPLLGDWQYEAAAVLCVMALAKECALPREIPAEPNEGDDEA